MYRNKLISRKDATEEKRRLVYNWTTDKAKIEFLNRESETLRDKIAAASDDYKNNPCVETADKLTSLPVVGHVFSIVWVGAGKYEGVNLLLFHKFS